jgi:hypothetical protein
VRRTLETTDAGEQLVAALKARLPEVKEAARWRGPEARMPELLALSPEDLRYLDVAVTIARADKDFVG